MLVLPSIHAADPDPATALAATIDQHLEADWAARGIKPAPLADDAEFCRRVYLDLIGRAPKVAETRAFLADPDPEKRAKLVDHLLAKPSHAAHFAAVTRESWLPQTSSDLQLIGAGVQFENWLMSRFRENTPADEVARRVLTLDLQNPRQAGNRRFVQPAEVNPENQQLVGFYQANEVDPANLGAAVSRIFLGVKLECARCHDHPFAPYSKEMFWEFAAFFAELNPLPSARPSQSPPTAPQADNNRLTIPDSTDEVVARFFDGSQPEWSDDRTPREELADWLTRAENPYFARNTVNRTWAYFFGIGLTDPVDEMGEENPPSHPELLDSLAGAFAESGFDNRVLVRAIARSRAYQLTSRLTHPTQADPRAFARRSVKGLTPAQLFDSLVAATGYREPANFRDGRFAAFGGRNDPRGRFLTRFASTDTPTETTTTILQALMMMNGEFVDGLTSFDRSEILGAVVDVPGWTTEQRVEAVFLTALARMPTPAERDRFGSYVERGGPDGDTKKALGDVFWVLLNSPEFLFNH